MTYVHATETTKNKKANSSVQRIRHAHAYDSGGIPRGNQRTRQPSPRSHFASLFILRDSQHGVHRIATTETAARSD